MKRIRPHPRPVRKAFAETDIGEEILIDISPAGTQMPEPPQLNRFILNQRWNQAKLGDIPDDAVATFTKLTTDYIVSCEFDKSSATPGQLRDYGDRVERVWDELHDILFPTNAAEQSIISLLEAGPYSPRKKAKLENDFRQFSEMVTGLRDQVHKPAPGEGRVTKEQQQARFAKAMFNAFEANKWPLSTSRNSLMGQTLEICIEAAGETVPHPGRLLSKSAKGN